MLKEKEKKLLKFIKYSPIILTVVIAVLINLLIYIQNNINSQKDINEFRKTYIQTQKLLVKTQVEKAYNDIINERKNLDIDLNESLKSRVREAYSIIENIYNTHKNKSEKEILKIIKSAIRTIRFNEGRGYFYIHNMSGENILHPVKPSLEGTNIIGMKDKRGVYILQDIIDNLKVKDEYFSELYWYKPNDLEKEYKKITYNRIFKPLDLIIGTGEYRDDFINNLKSHMLIEHIQKIFYGKNGYVFVVDYNGNYLAHVKKAYIGMNRINLIDKNGFEITKEIISAAKKGSGYVRYIGTIMPETGKPAQKTTYVVGLQDWEWAIATGFYDKELQRTILQKKSQIQKINSEYIKKILIVSLVLTIILIFVSVYISKLLERYFIDYNKRINEEINNNREKDYLLYQQTKMASMGEMIGNIAHQWRQPLNLISTVASGIKFEKEFGIKNQKNEDEGLDMILNSTNYLSQTIDDFRDFFKPDKQTVEVNLANTYEKVLQLISSRFKDNAVEIVSNIKDIKTYTYENMLIQVIINIFNNAFDALEEKQPYKKFVFVDIQHVKKSDLLNCPHLKDEEYIQIKIKDNAGGIPKDIIDKIFEIYFTTKHKARGTGVGLYMTYEIIKFNMEGEIDVKNVEYEYENEHYKGAQFTLYLPIKNN